MVPSRTSVAVDNPITFISCYEKALLHTVPFTVRVYAAVIVGSVVRL